MAKIDSITLQWNENHFHYNDSDSMTDYYHGYSGSLDWTIKCVMEDGLDVITVDVVNRMIEEKYLKRLKRLCKATGYKIAKEVSASEWLIKRTPESDHLLAMKNATKAAEDYAKQGYECPKCGFIHRDECASITA